MVFSGDGRALGKRAGSERHDEIGKCPPRTRASRSSTRPYLGRLDFFRRFGYRASAIRCEDQDLLLRACRGDDRPVGPALAKSQDQDLLVRSYQTARFANVPEILLGYREDRLDLRKILTSRYYFLISLFHERRPLSAAAGAAGQLAKGLVDALAIGTGLGYRLLRHRARPATEPEQDAWRAVWSGLQSAGPIGATP